jgi:beta-galactosidase
MDSRTRFGVRSLSFDAKTGLLLNGTRVLLKGGAIHHDNYMLGGAGIPRADERKLELMKAAGYNAVRSAHNPASQATLDAADRLGMLVIDEAFDMWSVGKRKNDYSRFFKDNWRADVSSIIRSGLNHPSVVIWSLGNEIPNLIDETGRAEAKALADLVHQLDPARPTTAAVHLFLKDTEAFIEILDVAGYTIARRTT